ncbi:CD99 antigen-like protein 2 isoform X2 [Sylvia atricapilla]|uniref:CD99 antigen-like protein 2 isoform X2 n=1 Tax=Sylvia atricapilla TaxID=48155 RepID=UPI00339A7127
MAGRRLLGLLLAFSALLAAAPAWALPASGPLAPPSPLAVGPVPHGARRSAAGALREVTVLSAFRSADPPSFDSVTAGFEMCDAAGHGDDADDLNLEDALFDIVTRRPTPKGPRKPAGGTGGSDFDLADYFDTPVETTTKAAKPTPRPFPRPGKPDSGLWDVIHTTTTKQPKTTRAPPKRNPAKDPMDLDLADALDDKNDRKDPGRPDLRPGEGFSDDDLASIVDGGYSPDKKKGASGNTDNNDYSGEGLNAEYVKGENMEAVVSEEPQVKYSVLETQSAEPPKRDSAKI